MASLTTLTTALVSKSLILFGSAAFMRHFYDELYCNPQCAMRLVHESDPLAYSRHPYWSGLKYDESCAGEKLAMYTKKQGNNSEREIMDVFVSIWTGFGALVAVRAIALSLFKSETFSAHGLVSTGVTVLVSLLAATTLLMHTHFNVDNTMMAGGIMHHANANVPGINDANGSVTEGYLINGACNRIFYVVALYLLISRDSRLSKLYSPLTVVGLMQIFMWVALKQVGKMHPVYHDWARNGATPEMLSALPYTAQWRAYKHCIVHHDNGLSFSGDLFLDPVYDLYLYAFAYVHNTLLQIPLGSPAHFACSTVSDAVMSAMNVTIFWAVLNLGSWVVPRYASFVEEGNADANVKANANKKAAITKTKTK